MLRSLLLLLLLAGCAEPDSPDLAPTPVFDPSVVEAVFDIGQTGVLARVRIHNPGAEPFRVEELSFGEDSRLRVELLRSGEELVSSRGFVDLDIINDEPLPLLGLYEVLHLEIAPVGRWSREHPWPFDIPVFAELRCDGDGEPNAVCGGLDCDDSDPEVRPGLVDVCDGVDRDCADPESELDQDGDGWRPCDGDCRDLLPDRYPGAPELCDGMDQNCDGDVSDEVDADGDGARVCDMDCDDNDPDSGGYLPETCNARDDDCDGVVDNGVLRVPAAYPSIQAALDVAEDGAVICVGPEPVGFHGPLVHDLQDVTIEGAGEHFSTMILSSALTSETEPMITVVGGRLRLSRLLVASHGPIARVEGGILEVERSSLIGLLSPEDGVAASGLHAIDSSVLLEHSSVLNYGEPESTVPAVRVDGGSISVLDVEFEDNLGLAPLVQVRDGLQVTFRNVDSTENVLTPQTPIFDLQAEQVDVRRLRAWNNVGVELAVEDQTAGYPGSIVQHLLRRDSLGPAIRAVGGLMDLSHFDVRTSVEGDSPLVDILEGDISVQGGFLAGSFGHAVGFAGDGGGGFFAENITVVGTVGGEHSLVQGLRPGSGLEIQASTVSIDGPVATWTASQEPWPGWAISSLATNFDVSEPLSFLGPDDLQVDAQLVHVDGHPAGWDLHLDTNSPLINAGDNGGVDPDGSAADLGGYGGITADEYDFDDDGRFQRWLPGPWDPVHNLLGFDCDDTMRWRSGVDGCD